MSSTFRAAHPAPPVAAAAPAYHSHHAPPPPPPPHLPVPEPHALGNYEGPARLVGAAQAAYVLGADVVQHVSEAARRAGEGLRTTSDIAVPWLSQPDTWQNVAASGTLLTVLIALLTGALMLAARAIR